MTLHPIAEELLTEAEAVRRGRSRTDTRPGWLPWSDGERAVIALWIPRVAAGMSITDAARRLRHLGLAHRSVSAIYAELRRALR